MFRSNRKRGFTLLETLLGVTIIAIVGTGVFQVYTTLLDVFSVTRIKISISALANEQMELIRNMPYNQIGTVGGIPPGVLAQVDSKERDGLTLSIPITIRNIDDPFDGTLGGVPNDTSPADYKLVELEISCTSCSDPFTTIFTGRAAPKALETSTTNGALFVRAIDASGLFISGATVQVVNNAVIPAVNVTDVTNSSGVLQLVDVIPATQTYEITVSKDGYSSEQTYAPGPGFNPVNPHATVAVQTVTQTTYSIDRTSRLDFTGVTNTCSAVGNIGIAMTGAKLISTSPNIPKYSQNLTIDATGFLSVPGLEWDTYSMTFTQATHDLAGTIPTSPHILNPNVTQDFKVVMAPSNPSALLVTVLDNATGLPLSDAGIVITRTGFSDTATTGRGFLQQTDWVGGSGQDIFTDPTQYFADDGGIDVSTAGQIQLAQVATSTYTASGWLESSTFDIGSPGNFYNITWNPVTQPADAGPDSVKFQIATATSTTPASWDFVGPDGTASTFFTTANPNISAVHNNDQYLRYKTFLGTASTTLTPSVTDLAITFSSNCIPPGQILFQGLTNDTYTVDVTKNGYQAFSDTADVTTNWQETIINLAPL